MVEGESEAEVDVDVDPEPEVELDPDVICALTALGAARGTANAKATAADKRLSRVDALLALLATGWI